MPALLDAYPKVRATFNLVPSLLAQIEDYGKEESVDLFLNLSRRNAEDLSGEEREFVLRWMRESPRALRVQQSPRYLELASRPVDAQFTTGDLRDLQVWFNLAWCDPVWAESDPRLAELKRKDHDFTEDDKDPLFEAQMEIMQLVIPKYRELADRGQAELTFSPYYHPILPLLCHVDSARTRQSAAAAARAPLLASRGRRAADRARPGPVRAPGRAQADGDVAVGDGGRGERRRPGGEGGDRLDDQRRGGAGPLDRGPPLARAPVSAASRRSRRPVGGDGVPRFATLQRHRLRLPAHVFDRRGARPRRAPQANPRAAGGPRLPGGDRARRRERVGVLPARRPRLPQRALHGARGDAGHRHDHGQRLPEGAPAAPAAASPAHRQLDRREPRHLDRRSRAQRRVGPAGGDPRLARGPAARSGRRNRSRPRSPGARS